MARKDPQGRKKAVPYNTFVQQFREEKYHQKKQALSRFRRFQRYEEQQQPAGTAPRESSSASLLERAWAEGQEALDAEYERSLALSFGGGGEDVDRPTKKKLKRKRKAAASSGAAGSPDTQDALGETAETSRSRKKKARRGEAAGEPQDSAPAAPEAEPAASAKGSKSKSKSEKLGSGKAKGQIPPTRYAKEMRKYQEAQDAKAAERRQREEEARERNHKRREFAKNRALKGGLLSQKTSRGQPKMQSVLELVTSKLAQEKAEAGNPRRR